MTIFCSIAEKDETNLPFYFPFLSSTNHSEKDVVSVSLKERKNFIRPFVMQRPVLDDRTFFRSMALEFNLALFHLVSVCTRVIKEIEKSIVLDLNYKITSFFALLSSLSSQTLSLPLSYSNEKRKTS